MLLNYRMLSRKTGNNVKPCGLSFKCPKHSLVSICAHTQFEKEPQKISEIQAREP